METACLVNFENKSWISRDSLQCTLIQERGKKAMHEINVLKIVLSLPLTAYPETGQF